MTGNEWWIVSFLILAVPLSLMVVFVPTLIAWANCLPRRTLWIVFGFNLVVAALSSLPWLAVYGQAILIGYVCWKVYRQHQTRKQQPQAGLRGVWH